LSRDDLIRPRRIFLSLLLCLAVVAAARAPRAEDAPVRVVVLPLEIHSARPLDDLQRSVPETLRGRLAASGVAVSDPGSAAAARSVATDPTDTSVRAVMDETGARFAVVASLTELAGRYSLDARLVSARPGVASQTLVYTADTEDELLQRANELGDRIASLVSRQSAPVVLDVAVEGVQELPPGVASKLSTRAGTPWDPEVARSDEEMLEGLPGVERATARTERDASGVRVVFDVLPLAPEAPLGSVEEATPDRIAGIEVRGNRRIEADAIRARVSSAPGEPYDPERVAADVREVFSLGFFRNVRVLSQDGPEGRTLVFEVEENPVVRQVAVAGNDSIDSDQIRDTLTLTTGSTLDHPLLYENVARIQGLYRSEGYYQAHVTERVEPMSNGAVAVTFEVDEGEKLRLSEIRFEGNEAFDDDELADGLKTKPWRFWSYATQYLDKSGTYSEPVFMQDLREVEKKYTDSGYLQVEISEPRVEVEDGSLVVTVGLKEGPRFSVGEIRVRGDSNADIDALREKLALKEGAVFNRSYLTQDVEQLTQHYTDRGYYFASVSPRTDVSPSQQVVDVEFEVQRGPLYFVNEIGVSGNTNTRDPVVRREIQLVEGQLYSARAVDTSKRRLKSLGFFEDVTFEPKQTDYPNQLDLDVKVVEKPTGSLSFGAGYSTQDSFIVSGALSESNLFGKGYATSLSVDIGGRTQRFYLSFSDPYFLDTTFSLGSTIYLTELQFNDFEERRMGVDISVGHALNEDNTARGFVSYSFSDREILDNVGVNAASLIFRELFAGDLTNSMLGVSARIERIDDRIAPSEGFQAAGSMEYSGLGGFSRFFRVEGRGAYYVRAPDWFPLPSTFMFGARAGYALPFNDISDFDFSDLKTASTCNPGTNGQVCTLNLIDSDLTLPLTERYFLGGLGTFQLRGFRARSVGPRRAVLYDTTLGGAFAGAFGGAPGQFGKAGPFTAVGRNGFTGECVDGLATGVNAQGDGDGQCNSLNDTKLSDFADLDETDVIGGNKFISLTAEYRFPISEALGLMGIVFIDMGNSFTEEESMFSVGDWRYGTGFGGLWFSPFGPLQAFMGFPLDKLSVEDSFVFEFSVGGANF